MCETYYFLDVEFSDLLIAGLTVFLGVLIAVGVYRRMRFAVLIACVLSVLPVLAGIGIRVLKIAEVRRDLAESEGYADPAMYQDRMSRVDRPLIVGIVGSGSLAMLIVVAYLGRPALKIRRPTSLSNTSAPADPSDWPQIGN